jgi:hypothetical protein
MQEEGEFNGISGSFGQTSAVEGGYMNIMTTNH